MMNNYLNIIIGFTAGACIGLIFFGGLWLTTLRLHSSRSSAPLLAGSYFGRIAVSVLGFYLVVTFTGFSGLIACLAGLVTAQLVLIFRFIKRRGMR